MQYVELLRVSRSVRICAIVLVGALFLNIVIWYSGGVTIDHQIEIPLTVVWAFSGFVASIFASVIAGSLAAENDGHLPVAWTTPASRVSYAAAKMAVDLGAIATVYLMAIGAVFIYFASIGVIHDLAVPSDTWWQFVRFLIAPAAFFGLMQLLTATLARQAGLVIGFTWVAAIVLLILELLPLPSPYGAIVSTIGFANPLIYITFDFDKNGAIIMYQLAGSLTALALIAAIGSAGAVYRWQRSEA